MSKCLAFCNAESVGKDDVGFKYRAGEESQLQRSVFMIMDLVVGLYRRCERVDVASALLHCK